jgi:cbb3-type cytochrome oxidase subunit 3
MRLSDIMSGMQLSSYAEVALILFVLAFVVVGCSAFSARRAAEWERCRRLPLSDEEAEPVVASGRDDSVSGTILP